MAIEIDVGEVLRGRKIVVHPTIINPLDNGCQPTYHGSMATPSSAEPAPFDIDRLRPSASLLAAQIALGAAIDRCAVDAIAIDPTVVDLLVRLEIAKDHELRAVEICRQLLLSASHISRVIDRAEKYGLVERRVDPDDRRASLVAPTAAGRAVAADFLPRLDDVLERTIYTALDAAEIETLIGLLDRIEASARSCTIDERSSEAT